ncbi:MAG: phosphohydrolase [Nitrospirae bacterium]|nr:phosphohydrolase [Nitrospirota bacterium]
MTTIKDVTGIDSGLRPDPMKIIDAYYEPGTKAHDYVTRHGRMVADKALAIAAKVHWLPPGEIFIEEAAMLHDVGIFMTDAPHLGCTGEYPYIAHGYLGRQIMEDEGYPLHALVCERHVGVGLTKEEIISKGLPLPARNMFPLILEEEIICFADKFFPVDPERMLTEITLEEARKTIEPYGPAKLRTFDRWAIMFGEAKGSRIDW